MPILLPEDLARPLPKLHLVRQHFDDHHLEDVEGAVAGELARPEIRQLVKPGARVAVAVGSRGIRNLQTIVSTVIKGLLDMGAQPFIVSAMGSHGGGTQEGQREVLEGYGITSQTMGVPVVTTVDTVLLGHTPAGRPVWFDREAAQADLVVPINRVKLHTDFVGPLQSGLCKMLVIGLGNHKGCSAVHEADPEDFAHILEEAAALILEKAPIGFGVAVLENAYDQTCHVEAVPAAGLIPREKELVVKARENMPCILLPQADVKVFLTASPEARATRRWKEYQQKGIDTPYEDVLADVKQRDYQDTHRAAAPLKQADDAVLLDTSELNFEQSFEAMKKIITEKVG